MPTVPFALSLHTLVNSVGADAGFAAIIGLAILVLLYFAQARETSTLRDRLDNASQWIEALETRLSQLHRSQAAQRPVQPPGVQPVPSPGVARRPGQPAVRPGGAPAGAVAVGAAGAARVPLPGAPAGMAAPALAAATRLIPVSGGVVPGAPGTKHEVEEETRVATLEPSAGEDTVFAPAPATAAALANGRSQSGVVAAPPAAPPPRVPARAANGPGAGGTGAVPLTARSGGARKLPPLRTSVPSGPSRARRLVPILIGLGVVIVVIAVLLIVTGNNKSTTTVHKSSKVSTRSKHSRAAVVNPATVTVAVLNGTTVTNLAHDVSGRLAVDGYKQGAIATAAAQTQTSTVVAYLAGHRADARAVAAVLDLKASAVKAVNQQAMGVACPGATTTATSSCSADVVVTVGSDLAGLASTQTG
jgi:hypothetical protein